MSGITTEAIVTPSCIESTSCSNLKNAQDIVTPAKYSTDNSSLSTSASATRLINLNIGNISSLNCHEAHTSNEFLNNGDGFDHASEQKATVIIKIETANSDSPKESQSSTLRSMSENSTLPPSLDYSSEEQNFEFLSENRKAIESVLQPISYDNARNCSLGSLNQTTSNYTQQFQGTQHLTTFQPRASAFQQFVIYNQLHPNVFQGYQNTMQSVFDSNQTFSNSFQTIQNNPQHLNGNPKYSDAFQLIQHGFQPHTNINSSFFTNGRQKYPNASQLNPSASQTNKKGIQQSHNEGQLPIIASQSNLSGNHPLANDFRGHPIESLVHLNASVCKSGSTPSKSEQSGRSPFLSVGPNSNGHPLPSEDTQQPNSSGNHAENSKRTFLDVIAHLEKYFRGDTCLLCGFKSSAKWPCRARQHLVTHLDRKDFQCGTCGKGFATPEYRLEHEKTHATDDPTIACSVCDAKFLTRAKLRRHEKTHRQDVKFQCPFCETRLATSTGLKSHLTIHTGELPHQCSMCPERFRTPCSLRLHVAAAHTGEKRFKCRVCDKGFNGKGLYEQHFATHKGGEGEFVCSECEKRFHYRSNLAQHSKTHSEERRHECGQCGKRFKFPHHLRSHVATHGDPDEE